jgi:hypothetical protein
MAGGVFPGCEYKLIETGFLKNYGAVLTESPGTFHRYGVYGITLRSPIRLSLPELPSEGPADIELRTSAPSYFSETINGAPLKRSKYSTYQYAHLPNGSSYVRWNGQGEFLVSGDGRLITGSRLSEACAESFQMYLLGLALSFSLVKLGLEPLHATAVVADGEAVAFLGDSGFGKSSLAACFVHAGDRLLTDDLLMLRKCPEGIQAFPGPPRIKLFPEMVRKFFSETVSGVPMNPLAKKLILPLDESKVCAGPVRLRTIYALTSPDEETADPGVRIESLGSREAFVTVVRNTFNYVILDPERIQRQFAETSMIVNNLRVKKLSHSRELDSLPDVRNAILADLRNADSRVPACAG